MIKKVTQVVYHDTTLELDPDEALIVLKAGLIFLGVTQKEDQVKVSFECGMAQAEGYLECVKVEIKSHEGQGSVGKLKDEPVKLPSLKDKLEELK